MTYQIIKKEYIKIKKYFYILILFNLLIAIYFAYDLNYQFSNIEPESMIWYSFAHLEQKPYMFLNYVFLLTAIFISLIQFVNEKIKNRIRILCHLPISMHKSIVLHLFVGIIFILFLNVLLGFLISVNIYFYYPFEVLHIYLKDFLFFNTYSILIYLALSASIIEVRKIVFSLKLFLTLTIVFIYIQNIYHINSLLWFIVLIYLFFLCIDSLYSVKKLKNNSIFFKLFTLITILIVASFTYEKLSNDYKNTFNRYYIFYSPILKDFIYQKNLKGHNFEYKDKNNNKYTRQNYEKLLPFVYWRNLDIQGKLPIIIDDMKYEKDKIKDSRLSFSYKKDYLKKPELLMYPFINAISHTGMIKFPEEVLVFTKNKIKVYNFDERLDKKLTNDINNLVKQNHISFPIKAVWGKATNMKPYDLGYFIKDTNNKIFNIKRANNKITIKKSEINKNIIFMKISENKQKNFIGYAIDKKSNFYLISYDSYKLQKLNIKEFDYKNMNLQFISNPLYYTVRFSNKYNSFAYVFTKNLKQIDSIKLKN